MIPSAQKVGKDLFKILLSTGRTFPSGGFSLRVFFEKEALKPKFSVVVGKKIDSMAVGRNLIKRRVYAVLEPLLRRAKPGSRVAIFLKKKISAGALPSLKSELESVLRTAGVL